VKARKKGSQIKILRCFPTFKPRAPALRRASREFASNAFSGTRPPQKPSDIRA